MPALKAFRRTLWTGAAVCGVGGLGRDAEPRAWAHRPPYLQTGDRRDASPRHLYTGGHRYPSHVGGPFVGAIIGQIKSVCTKRIRRDDGPRTGCTRKALHQKTAIMIHDRITIDPDVMFGKPVIKGTRIPVEQILRKLGGGQSVESILEDHPHLSKADILAAIRFAADYMADETDGPIGEEHP